MNKYLPYVILLLALGGSLGSLYFSEILHFIPCTLCWYQRIAMYPIIAVATVSILVKDKNLPLYVLPLAIFGWLIAFYHNLLYYKIIPEPIVPCQSGVSCTQQLVQLFGFIDIPLGSFITFTFIIVCCIMLLKLSRK